MQNVFFRFLIVAMGVCLLLAKPLLAKNDVEKKKVTPPNIVLIIADDMAWDDSIPYGNDAIKTPNLKRMANEGMRFDNAFLTISSCSPSRASIITGMYPNNTGAEELHWPIPEDRVTFVEKLKTNGYWTGAAGKWHLGEAMRDRFDVVMGTKKSKAQPSTRKSKKSKKAKESEKSDDELKGDAQSGCANWLPLMEKRTSGKPFFLWLASVDPHRPYRDGILPENASHKPEMVTVAPYHPDTPEVRADYAQYYDEISRLDKHVGLVLDQLETDGVAENTLVLFISDNGRPFPRDKTTLYDSGIKTPWIVRWPGRVKAGSVCRRLVSAVDIAPTALALAGIGERVKSFEGRSFLRLLDDSDRAIREFIFAEKNWHDYEDHARAVRNERYKYIRNYYKDLPLTPPADAVRSATYEVLLAHRDAGKLLPHQVTCFTAPREKEELYDTVSDPFELRNLAADERYSPVIKAMREALYEWEKRSGDSPPDLRTADEFDRTKGTPTSARTHPRWSKQRMIEAGLTAP